MKFRIHLDNLILYPKRWANSNQTKIINLTSLALNLYEAVWIQFQKLWCLKNEKCES